MLPRLAVSVAAPVAPVATAGQYGKIKKTIKTMASAPPPQPPLVTIPEVAEPPAPAAAPQLLTEDTGKIFEMAICLALNTPFVGPYKYSMADAETLAARIRGGGLSGLGGLSGDYLHTANRGARYDFTSATDPTQHLSAKTTKKGVGKVSPQVIGQSQPAKFCELCGIPAATAGDIAAIKEYIQTHITDILPILVEYTFDCPNLYYNRAQDSIRYIRLAAASSGSGDGIDWSKYSYTWTCPWETWRNSSTLKIDGVALVEFQFHTKKRTNMAIRWCYENFLSVFRDHLEITAI